jgi:RAP1 GTPase activating protein 1
MANGNCPIRSEHLFDYIARFGLCKKGMLTAYDDAQNIAPRAADINDSDMIQNDATVDRLHSSLRLPVQDSEHDVIAYTTDYLPYQNSHYVAGETAAGPVFVTVRNCGNVVIAMVRTALGTTHLLAPLEKLKRPAWYDKILMRKWPTAMDLLQAVGHPLASAPFQRIRDSDMSRALLRFDERLVILQHKVGVVFAGPGQDSFDEMLANGAPNVPPQFWRFMNFLGEQVDLRAWQGYSGGLDTSRNGYTGETTFYTRWQQLEIVFHAAPLIPSPPRSSSVVDRKRHIGNDIVVIVFRDKNAKPVKLETLKSKAVQVVVVVTPMSAKREFEFSIELYRRRGVPDIPILSGPILSVRNTREHRDLLLTQLLLAERASYKAPPLANLIGKTRSSMLRELVYEFM